MWGARAEKKGKRGAALDAAADAYAELLDKIGAVNEATEDAFAYGNPPSAFQDTQLRAGACAVAVADPCPAWASRAWPLTPRTSS